tara:strand:- start:1224 stop:2348 length:1125 start_codon:yes stop_codon:yes gene_type:complete
MNSIEYSERFLNFVRQQLISFQSDPEVERIVVYVASSGDSGSPTLEVVGQWPKSEKVLQPVETDTALRTPSSNRRWYPLQEGSILLGVIRAERIPSEKEWPESLDQSLQATSIAVANSLAFELDRKRLLDQLNDQKEQISLMVHQLRNPLAALGIYAKLLLRKLGPESEHENLVKGLITEQAQVDKYLSALDQLSQVKLPQSNDGSNRLLLPPLLPTESSVNLKTLIEPLIQRAKARANLQGRKWFSPTTWPDWMEKSRSISEGVIAEIVANLLENAFRYSSPMSSLGIEITEDGICIWDEGTPIKAEEREKIFEKGFRGESSSKISGTGIGLALARDLARQVGGDLNLILNPSQFNNSLPELGNAFVFSWEPK